MTIALGADHRGYALKEKIKILLQQQAIQVLDMGTYSLEAVDYPEYALSVCRAVIEGRCDSGILVCFNGTGMSIAANKVRGIRAALCLVPQMVGLARAHNNANVLCLSSGFVTEDVLPNILRSWIETPFEGGRHGRRVDQITTLEQDNYTQKK